VIIGQATRGQQPRTFLAERTAATFIEMVVYLLLFSILLGGVGGVFLWMKHSQSSMARLDVLHQLRSSSFRLSEQLSYAVDVIFPPEQPLGQAFHQLVFRDAANEIIVLFLNRKRQLVQLNWTRTSPGNPSIQPLTDDAVQFVVRRPTEFYVEYDVRVMDEKKREFSLTNSVRLKNRVK